MQALAPNITWVVGVSQGLSLATLFMVKIIIVVIEDTVNQRYISIFVNNIYAPSYS